MLKEMENCSEFRKVMFLNVLMWEINYRVMTREKQLVA
jgi:hypothetical protein